MYVHVHVHTCSLQGYLHVHVHCVTVHVYHLQLTVYVLYKEIEYGRQLREFIAGFHITVETIEEILPSVKHRLDNFFYDANSFAEAYYCK